jgi:hypothetical protein
MIQFTRVCRLVQCIVPLLHPGDRVYDEKSMHPSI